MSIAERCILKTTAAPPALPKCRWLEPPSNAFDLAGPGRLFDETAAQNTPYFALELMRTMATRSRRMDEPNAGKHR